MDSSNVRRRTQVSGNDFLKNGVKQQPKKSKNTQENFNRRKPISPLQFLSFLCLIVVVLTGVVIVEKQLPIGLKIQEEYKYPNRFIAERAYNHLKDLTALGPRIAGSHENNVLAVNLLTSEIKKIINNAKKNNIIELDVQTVSGDFALTFLDGMTNVYRNLQNIVVKVGSNINSSHSLLINCHYDSVVDSPGASDDGAGCAVMLEMLRVISRSSSILRHNIIFLFNGGEENFLPASHGFITKHKWASEVKAFINLEACGAGGREVLFQAGPHQPWMLETYAEQVPYPYASSMAQEIFQSGVIPGDTDYRIFRDFGNVSGLDFAWSANGYVYHTRFDAIQQVPLGSLQRTGDNILALARGLAMGHQLSQVTVSEKQDPSGHFVFFDFLGAFVVRWSMFTADLVNVSAVLISFYALYRNMKDSIGVLSYRKYVLKVSYNIMATLGSWLLGIAGAGGVAMVLTGLDRTMSWYGRPMWLFFLYVIPSVLVTMCTLLLHSKYAHKDIDVFPWLRYQLYYDSCQLVWTLILIVGILLRIRSSFIVLLWVGSSALSNLIKSRLFKKPNSNRSSNGWLMLHIGMLGLPFVQSLYLLMGALYLFVPIMGRTGGAVNIELALAVLVSILVALQTCWAASVVLLVREVARVLNLLLGLVLLSVAVLLLTPLGFPYTGGSSSMSTVPAPQRFMLCHMVQTVHDGPPPYLGTNTTVSPVRTRSGYWIIDMDMNSPQSVVRHVPEVAGAEPIIAGVSSDCVRLLYCGLPYLVPVLSMYSTTHWLPAPAPLNIPSGTYGTELVKIENVAETENDRKRIHLKLTGPAHIGVMLSPVPGVQLVGWDLTSEPLLTSIPWNGRDQYFIFYASGTKLEPFEFYLEFKVPTNHVGYIIDLATTTQFMFGPLKMSTDFKEFAKKFPPWTAVSAWSATYDSWKI